MDDDRKAQIFLLLSNIERGNKIRAFELMIAKADAKALGRLEVHDVSASISYIDISMNDPNMSYNVNVTRMSSEININTRLSMLKHLRASKNTENDDENEIENLLNGKNQNVKRMLLNILELGRDNILQEEYVKNINELGEGLDDKDSEISVFTGYADDVDSEYEDKIENLNDGRTKRVSEMLPAKKIDANTESENRLSKTTYQPKINQLKAAIPKLEFPKANNLNFSMIRPDNEARDSELDISLYTRGADPNLGRKKELAKQETELETPNTVRNLKRFADIAKNSIFRNEAINILKDNDLGRSGVMDYTPINRTVQLKPLKLEAFKRNKKVTNQIQIEEESELLESEEDIVDLNNDLSFESQRLLRASKQHDEFQDNIFGLVRSSLVHDQKKDSEYLANSDLQSQIMKSHVGDFVNVDSGPQFTQVVPDEGTEADKGKSPRDTRLLNSIYNSHIHNDVFKGYINSDRLNNFQTFDKVSMTYDGKPEFQMRPSDPINPYNITSIDQGFLNSFIEKNRNMSNFKPEQSDVKDDNFMTFSNQYSSNYPNKEVFNSKVSNRYSDPNAIVMEMEDENELEASKNLFNSRFTNGSEERNHLLSPNNKGAFNRFVALKDSHNEKKIDESINENEESISFEHSSHKITDLSHKIIGTLKLSEFENSNSHYFIKDTSNQKKSDISHIDVSADGLNDKLDETFNNNTDFIVLAQNYMTFKPVQEQNSQIKATNTLDTKKQVVNKRPEVLKDDPFADTKDLKLIKAKAKVTASIQVVQSPKQRKHESNPVGPSKLRVSLTQSLVSVRKSVHVGISLTKLESIIKSLFKKRLMLGLIFIQFLMNQSRDSEVMLGVSILNTVSAIHLRNAYDVIYRYCVTNVKMIYLIQQMAYALNKKNLIEKLTILKKKRKKPRKLKNGEIKLFAATFDHIRRNKMFDCFHKIIHVNIMGEEHMEEFRRSRIQKSVTPSVVNHILSAVQENKQLQSRRFSCFSTINRPSQFLNEKSETSRDKSEKIDYKIEEIEGEEYHGQNVESDISNSFKAQFDVKGSQKNSGISCELTYTDDDRISKQYNSLSRMNGLKPHKTKSMVNPNVHLEKLTKIGTGVKVRGRAGDEDEIVIEDYGSASFEIITTKLHSKISQLTEQINYILANLPHMTEDQYDVLELEILSNVSTLLTQLKDLRARNPRMTQKVTQAIFQIRKSLKKLTHNDKNFRTVSDEDFSAFDHKEEPQTPFFNLKSSKLEMKEVEKFVIETSKVVAIPLAELITTLQTIKMLFYSSIATRSNNLNDLNDVTKYSFVDDKNSYKHVRSNTCNNHVLYKLPSFEFNFFSILAKVELKVTFRNKKNAMAILKKSLKIDLYLIVQRLFVWKFSEQSSSLSKSLYMWKKKRNNAVDFIMAHMIKLNMVNLKRVIKILKSQKAATRPSLDNHCNSYVYNTSQDVSNDVSNLSIADRKPAIVKSQSLANNYDDNRTSERPLRANEGMKFVLYKNRDKIKESVQFMSSNGIGDTSSK